MEDGVQFGLEEIGVAEIEFEPVVGLQAQFILFLQYFVIDVGVVIQNLGDDCVCGFGACVEVVLDA
jgi:hypothetical protein